jgi:hypothetical protein
MMMKRYLDVISMKFAFVVSLIESPVSFFFHSISGTRMKTLQVCWEQKAHDEIFNNATRVAYLTHH